MAKCFFWISFLAAFLACKNQRNERAQRSDDNLTKLHGIQDDSTCMCEFSNEVTEGFQLIKFCDIIIGDDRRILSLSHDGASKMNFNQRNLRFFKVKGDTLEFSNYFMTASSVFLYPTKMFLKNDTFHFRFGYRGDTTFYQEKLHMQVFDILVEKGRSVLAIMWDTD